MRRRVRLSHRRAQRITLNLASMIDVTFLLLIYFMLTTVLVQPEDRLSSTLQTRTGAAPSDLQPQVIEVVMHDGEAVYRLGEQMLNSRAALAQVLASLPKSEGIFVQVSDAAPVDAAVTALQLSHDAGFAQVTYVPE